MCICRLALLPAVHETLSSPPILVLFRPVLSPTASLIMTPRYLRLIFPRSSCRKPRKIYQFHKGDFVGLKASLTTLSSDYLSTHPECNIDDENCFYISQKILEATNNFIPHKISKGKRHPPPGSAPL